MDARDGVEDTSRRTATVAPDTGGHHMLRKLATVLVAATALLAASAGIAQAAPAAPDFGAQAQASGFSAAQAQDLQERVSTVLGSIAGGKQVSPTKVEYDGLTVTFAPKQADGSFSAQAISCSYTYFCINVGGEAFAFTACRWWDLSNWEGSSPYNNNQTSGTVFRAYNQNYTQVWSSTAPASGSVNVTPWWHIKPC
jgi:hypothetical protein